MLLPKSYVFHKFRLIHVQHVFPEISDFTRTTSTLFCVCMFVWVLLVATKFASQTLIAFGISHYWRKFNLTYTTASLPVLSCFSIANNEDTRVVWCWADACSLTLANISHLFSHSRCGLKFGITSSLKGKHSIVFFAVWRENVAPVGGNWLCMMRKKEEFAVPRANIFAQTHVHINLKWFPSSLNLQFGATFFTRP